MRALELSGLHIKSEILSSKSVSVPGLKYYPYYWSMSGKLKLPRIIYQ